MADIVPFHLPGDTVTGHCEVAVTGGRLVSISGPRVDGNYQVSPTAAGARAFGVAARDKAAGEKVMIFGAPGTIVPIECAVAIAAGDRLMSDAVGRVVVWAAGNVCIGEAVDDAAINTLAPAKLALDIVA